MRRSVAITWHASFLVASAVLYFFFVLPRWYELAGTTSHTLGTALRIVCGVLVALSALPVLLTLQRTSKPEYATPQLALSLRIASIALHILGGVLILGTAISEIWLTLDKAGVWLFGIYGAAAGVTLLAALTFYLAFLAELPPPPPKPIKAKKAAEAAPEPIEPESEATDEASEEQSDTAESEAGTEAESEDAASTDTEETAETEAPAAGGKLRNRRAGKGSGLLGRSGGASQEKD
ncbi:MAG: hypothetical protein WCE30_02110 [Mycobacterium sp.]